MANYNREEVEKQSKAEKGTISTLVVGGIARALAIAVKNSQKKEQAQRDQARLYEIEKEISGYKNKFLGSVIYANEIAALESEGNKIVQKYNKKDNKKDNQK